MGIYLTYLDLKPLTHVNVWLSCVPVLCISGSVVRLPTGKLYQTYSGLTVNSINNTQLQYN